MNKLKESKTTKVVAGLVGLVTAVFMMGPVVASADAVSDLQAQIAALMAQINSLNAQVAATTGSGSCAYTFATNLKVGSKGTDVMNLQKVLNMSADTQVSASGAGSPGKETSTFGPATKGAVIKFQNKYKSDILTPVGLTSGTGNVGASTRAKLNAMCTSSTTTTTTTTTPTTGGLMVSNTTQPANSLAVWKAASLPFTKVMLTAGASDVTVNSVTVERTGLAQDAVFAGVVLLDENGTRMGIARTFNSNHQVALSDPFTVKAGTTRTITVAGDMETTQQGYAGQVASLSVVSINTTATISGSFPITGANHTINESLTIGTISSISVSSFDPGTGVSKNIGDTGIRFSGIRITAGSGEDVSVKSIKWNQTGSAGSSDLTNLVTVVNGTSYPTTVSSDGKYYTSSFGSGVTVAKGNNLDIYIQGDLTGSGSASRTVIFDIYKTTDLNVVGLTFGYGITPPAGTGTVITRTTTSASTFTTGSPWFLGVQTTINAGTVTSISKSVSIPAQNIAINVSNQPLGGYTTDVKGEPITVQSQVFHFATSSVATWGAGTTYITSVSLIDENGATVAGPSDAVIDGTGQKVTFTSSVTYPVGKHTYTLKGKIPSLVNNGIVIVTSTAPATDWTNIIGQTTGNTITLTTTTFNMNAMTVKSAALAITMSTSPAAQTIVSGGTAVTFANIQFDASQSGEDVRFSSVTLTNSVFAGLSTCQLYDGSTALNTGSNVITPAATMAFTFDSALTIAKNTVKTLTLKCNVSSSAVGPFTWTVTPSVSNPTTTGVTSGASVTATGSAGTSASMAIGTGSLLVSVSPSSPSYAIASAGTTGNTAAIVRFRATNESVNLNRMGLTLTGGLTSSADLVQVSIWDGGTQVGTAIFTGGNSSATSTFATPVVLPKDADKDLTVKVDLATISGTTNTGGTQGALVKIDSNATTDPTGTQGTGVNSGTTINATGSTAVSGIRLYKSYPTFALDTLTSTGMADGRLMRFKVTANSNGGVGLNQFRFTIATSTGVGITSINLYGYTDAAYSTGISGFSSGQIQATSLAALTSAAVTIAPSAVVNVPAGTTYYFELRGTVTGTVTGSSVITTLSGDAAYTAGFTPAYTAGGLTMMATSSAYVLGLSGNNVLWSPNATTTTSVVNQDWTNAYGVVGLPSSGLIQSRSN